MAVAAGCDRLAWGKHATTLAILTLLCKFWAATSHFLFSFEFWNENSIESATSVDMTSFDFRFEEQYCFVNIHLLCYRPTIHNSISRICPKFQVVSSHLFEVDELLDELWAKIARSENISTPIYVERDKMYRSKVCVQEFSYFVTNSCLALIFKLKNPSTTVPYAKKSVAGGEIRRVIYRFFSIRTYGLVVMACCKESGDMGSIPDECWNPLLRLGHFAWHWARQCTDTRAFYIAALSIIFSFLDFVSGNLALTEL